MVQYDPCTYDQNAFITNLVNTSSMPIIQLWLEASHPQMLLIYAYCKGRSCRTLFLQWREYFVGITSSEVAAVLRKWRTEGQCTMCILSSMFSFQPNKLRHILKVAS